MITTKFGSWAFAGALLLAGICLAAPLQAQEDSPDDCAVMCRDTLGNCHFDAREAAAVCVAGCDELRSTYRDACLVAERDEEACNAARDDLRTCLDSCKDTEEGAAATCQDDAETCLTDGCGLQPRRPHGRHPRRGR
jgi:hypothetical protein